MDDLKAFILLTAVKNLRDDVVARLVQRINIERDIISEDPERSAPFVAFSLASLHLKDDLNQRILTSFNPEFNLGWWKDQVYEDNDRRRKGLSLFTWAIQCGHHSVVGILAQQMSLQDNMDACAKGCNEMTPLELASCCGHEAITRTLMMNGADVQESGHFGMTVLHYASGQGHVETVRMLLRHGAEIETQDWEQSTSLHFASRTGQADVVKILVDNGANIESKDGNKRTPLYIAAEFGHENVMKLLIDNGANIETKDEDGSTPLHSAAVFGHESVMEVLIANGANIEARDLHGRTPIMRAASEGHETAVLLLLEKGANLLATDNSGMDIRHWVLNVNKNASGEISYLASDDLIATVYEKACQSMHAKRPQHIILVAGAEVRSCLISSIHGYSHYMI